MVGVHGLGGPKEMSTNMKIPSHTVTSGALENNYPIPQEDPMVVLTQVEVYGKNKVETKDSKPDEGMNNSKMNLSGMKFENCSVTLNFK